MLGLLLAVVGAYGVFLLYTHVVLGWTGIGFGPRVTRQDAQRDRLQELLTQSGLGDVRLVEVLVVVVVLFVIGAGLAFALFAGPLPAVVAGLFAASFPIAGARARRRQRLELAREAWPRMIEEIRLMTVSVGMSIPQALFAVGRRGPEELHPAFEAAQREWLISTDFARTVAVLKQRLADPTADATLETLLIAHEIGGSSVGERLSALVEDRIQDLQGRKDARAKQAGVRFARGFVLVVPLGMALVGLSIGSGRAAYSTPLGQIAVVMGLGLIAVCWVWASQMLRLPEEERVFYE